MVGITILKKNNSHNNMNTSNNNKKYNNITTGDNLINKTDYNTINNDSLKKSVINGAIIIYSKELNKEITFLQLNYNMFEGSVYLEHVLINQYYSTIN